MAERAVEVATRDDVCALPLVRRLAATLDQDPGRWREGDVLPRAWYVIMFTVDTPQSQLRRDGMAGLGLALPEVDLPRVVLGGRRAVFRGDIHVGAHLRRVSRIGSVTPKAGRSGPLVVVTVHSEISKLAGGEPLLVEEQDYVFRGPPASSAQRSTARGRERRPSDVTGEVTPDETLLFRYSALTFNTHRIHFDRPYATEQEHYPALVVNGGLTTLLAAEFFRAQAGREPTALTIRNLAPLFCNDVMRLKAIPGQPTWHVWVEGPTGEVALEATFE